MLVGCFFGYRNVVQSLVSAVVATSACEASFEVAMQFVAWLRENHVKDADYVTRQWLAKVIAKAKAGSPATSPKEMATGQRRVPLAPHGQIGEAFGFMRRTDRLDQQQRGLESSTRRETVAELELREKKLKARAARAASTYKVAPTRLSPPWPMLTRSRSLSLGCQAKEPHSACFEGPIDLILQAVEESARTFPQSIPVRSSGCPLQPEVCRNENQQRNPFPLLAAPFGIIA